LNDESNSGFASILSKYINEPLSIFYRKLMYEYGLLARFNPVVRFNLDRLYLNHAGAGKYQGKVDVFV
jgi:hypothetical protein